MYIQYHDAVAEVYQSVTCIHACYKYLPLGVLVVRLGYLLV